MTTSLTIPKLPVIKPMDSPRSGNAVANQLIIEVAEGRIFQSYGSNIVFEPNNGKTVLDQRYWDYSKTTGKYRNEFLGEKKAETEAKIKNGTYILGNLNSKD